MKDNCKVIEAYPMKLPYPGAFHPNISKRIKNVIGTKFCVHLFSGSSKIGNIRIDINHKNATENIDVFEFIQREQEFPNPSVLLMDPDYDIQRKDKKLNGHGCTASVSASVKHRNILKRFISKHDFDEIIYLDQCSPKFKGYEWQGWLVKTGGWHTVRVLNHYKKIGRLFN